MADNDAVLFYAKVVVALSSLARGGNSRRLLEGIYGGRNCGNLSIHRMSASRLALVGL